MRVSAVVPCRLPTGARALPVLPWYGHGYTRSQVRTYAGVPAGVTPGVLVSYGLTGASLTNDRRSITITSRDDIEAVTGVTGTGTYADPYTLTRLEWYSPNSPSAGPHLTWNDTDADYWIRIHDTRVNTQQGTYNCFVVDCGLNAGLIFERCVLRGQVMVAAQSMVELTSGNLIMRTTLLTELRSYFVRKAGASAHVVWEDSKADNTQGQWNSSTPYFQNNASGGSLIVSRVTADYRQETGGYMSSGSLWAGANWQVSVWRLSWRPGRVSGNDAGNGGFLCTNTTAFTEAHTSGFTMRESRIYAGVAADFGTLIGMNNGADNRSTKNWTLEHCDIIALGTSWSGARLIALGDNANTDPEHTVNHVWSFCRFIRPQATGIVAGNEVFEYWRSSDILVVGCWIDSCGEDGFEFVEAYRSCRVLRSGGGEVSGSYVGGQIVDFYGGMGSWTGSTACEVGDLWGEARGDAMIVDGCTNVLVHDISVVNDDGGFAQNPPAASVRLHSHGAGGLNGTRVSLPLSPAAQCFNGKPCELTYQSGAHNAGSVVWPEWNGTSFDWRGGTDGIVDAT